MIPSNAPLLGAIWWGYNAKGCFLWARVLQNGRLFIQADMKIFQRSEEDVAGAVLKKTDDMGLKFQAVYGSAAQLFPPLHPLDTEVKPKPSIQVETPSEVFARFGLTIYPVTGLESHQWQRVHDYLRDAPDGKPWLIVSPQARTLLRTLPTLVQARNPDDVEGETYAANCLRVLVSARPSTAALRQQKIVYPYGTLGWWKAQDDKDAERGALRRRHA